MLKSKILLIVLSVLAAASLVTAVVAIPFTSFVTGDQTEVKSFEVKFETNGGSAVHSQNIEENGLVVKPTDPHKENHTFKGWFKDSACTEAFNFEKEVVTGEFTLYAKWEKNGDSSEVFDISFDVNGKTVDAPAKIADVNKIPQLPELDDITGYHFKGWCLDETCHEPAVVGASIGDDVTLYAKWVEVFTVTFTTGVTDLTVDPIEVELGELCQKPTDPVRTDGIPLESWTTDTGAVFDFENTPITGNITLTAKWGNDPATKYTITFDLDGGTGTAPTLESQSAGAKITIPAGTGLKKTGYSFGGWSYNGHNYVANNHMSMPTENVEFKAIWTPVTYSISYNLAEGNLASGESNPESYTIETETITLKNPTREGYRFDGWFIGETKVESIVKGSTGNKSLVAKWSLIYKITFELDGGEGTAPTLDDACENDKIVIPSGDGLKKQDLHFAGWICSKDNQVYQVGNKYTMPAENVTFTAKWSAEKPAEYTIKFTLNGGEGTAPVDKVLVVGAGIDLPDSTGFSKANYDLAGWTYNGTEYKVGDHFIVPASDVTFEAKWTAKKFTITYDLDGGNLASGESNPDSYTIETETITLKNPTKSGYTFIGWYEGNTKVESIVKGSTGNKALVAKWEAVVQKYNVNFELNEGEGTAPTVDPQAAGASVTIPTSDIQKTGMHFTGWLCSADNKVYQAGNVFTMPAEAVTFTAQWSAEAPATFEVTFDSVDGTYIEKQTITANGVVTEPDNPEKNGFVFLYWQDATNQKYDFTTPVTENMTLTAVYRARTIYDDLAESQDKILNDDFDSYKDTEKLPVWSGTWGTKGIYSTTGKSDKSTVEPSDTTTFIKLGDGTVQLMDTSDGASVQLLTDFGGITAGTVEGYFETKLVNPGDNWTFFQMYGENSTGKGKEIFGIRAVSGKLQYRLNGGSPTETGIVNSYTVENGSTYKIHYIVNLTTDTITVSIQKNNEEMKVFVQDISLDVIELSGYKLVSSDGGSKTQVVDYIAVTNMNLTLNQYIDRVKNNLNEVYASYDVDNKLAAIKADMEGILSEGLSGLEALKASDAATALDSTNKKTVDDQYAAVVKQLADKALAEQLKNLAAELDTYKDKSLYTGDNLTTLNGKIDSWKTQILAATSYEAGVTLQEQAKADLNTVLTDAEVIAKLQNDAIAELEITYPASRYTENKATYDEKMSAAKTAIKAATTKETIAAELEAGKVELDKIETDEAILTKYKAAAEQAVTTQANEYTTDLTNKAVENYANYVQQINTVATTGKNSIHTATSKSMVDSYKADTLAQMEDIYQAGNMSLDELKNKCKDELTAYATAAVVGYDDQTLLSEVEAEKTSGIEGITAATTKEDVLTAFNNAKQAIDACIADYNSSASDTIVKQGAVKITAYAGLMESAYAEFEKLSNATGYSIYVKGGKYADFTKADEKIAYVYEKNSKMRVDLLGLTPSRYNVKIVPIIDSSENEEAASIFKSTVAAYDRSGFAHFNYTDGVGAYKDDGTLKDNAIVIYVTDANKNDVTVTLGDITVTGIGNILNSVGQECGEAGHEGQCKKTSGGKTIYATANGNKGIIKKLAEANVPLVVRFIGCVSDSGLGKSGTFSAASPSLINGLTAYDANDYGGSVGDNGHMARMKSGKNITLEGVGSDAIIDGWGFHFMAESAAPELGKNFEVRNLTFINTPEDAIGMEGVQASDKVTADLTASVERCWVHHNEFYAPSISNPAESDKSEGDGSCDFKRGQYFTCSYNYFEGCHKTNLIGSSDTSLQYNITFHHNYWKLCEARGPLVRNSNVHMYNNVFDGQISYAMNPRANAYIYSEYNLFYMCKSPQSVDSGAIKSYKDSFSSCINDMTGTIVTDKSQVVQNNCQFSARGIDYSKFDTNPEQSYIPSGNYQLQTNITEMRKFIEAYGGTQKDILVDPTTISTSQISYLPEGVTPNVVSTYPTTLTPGKISKTVYAFTIDRMASVTVSCASEDAVLVNEAGEAFLTGSGTVLLMPGTYMLQPTNFQPGKPSGVFKETTVNSIEIKEHNSEEFDNKQIADFEAKVAKIPSPVKYDDNSYNLIKSAMDAYSALRSELKARVDYTPVEAARKEYINLGKAYVEAQINAIGTVNQNSGAAISNARSAYNNLLKHVPDISISNYATLTAAEAAFEAYAVQSCIDKINAIPETITLDAKDVIEAAKSEYDSLDEDKQKQVTNASKLLAAEKTLDSLLKVEHVNELVTTVDTTNLVELRTVIKAYEALTAEEKQSVSQKISNVQVQYVKTLISSIGTVTSASGAVINEADQYYTNSLTPEQQALVDNYDVLTAAKEAYQVILSQKKTITFEGGSNHGDTDFFKFTGSYKSGVTATYEGTTYKDGIKMESSTNITFGSCKKLTIVASTPGQKVKIDGKSYAIGSDGILVVDLDSTVSSHTITKDSTNTFICAIIAE